MTRNYLRCGLGIALASVVALTSAFAAGPTQPAIGQLQANPSGARTAIRTNPAFYTPMDFSGAGDAQRGYVVTLDVPATTNPKVSLLATYQLDGVTVNCPGTANNNNTITLPAGVLPAQILGGASVYRVYITACGTGAWQTANTLTSIAGSGAGPYTLTTSQASNVAFSGATTVIFMPTQFAQLTTATASTSHFYHYGPGSIAGTTLTMPASTFNVIRDVTQIDAAGLVKAEIAIDDPAGVCPQYRGHILLATSTTVATLDVAPSCVPAGANLAIWSGPILFPTTAGTGPTFPGTPWKCELLTSGTSVIPNTILPIGSYLDPFHVIMTGVTQLATVGGTSALTCGTPDWTALDAASAAAFSQGYASLYLPPGHNYFVDAGDTLNIGKIQLCSDGNQTGRIFWPSATPSLVNATRCTPSRGQPQARTTINPKVNLPHSLSVTGRPIKVVSFSDSMFQSNSNGMGDVGSGSAIIHDWLSATLGKPVQFFAYNIGGTTIYNLAPNFPVSTAGNGVGIPTTAEMQTVSGWYTNTSQKWIDYGKAACPDLVMVGYQNDGYNLSIGAFYDINGYINSWQSACGYTPDIIWMTDFGGSATADMSASPVAVQEHVSFQEDFIRTAVLSGDTLPPGVVMGNGGQVGLLDFEAMLRAREYGSDYYEPPMTRAVDIAAQGQGQNQGVQIKWPFSWPRSVRNWSLNFNFEFSSPTNMTTTTFWNTALGGAFNIPLGNGNAGTPYTITGQSSPLAAGYPNNMLSIQRDSSGFLAVTGYTYRLTETATCSMASTTLTCTTPVANAGYYYSNIIIQGAGSALCPVDIGGSNCLFTSIAAAGVNNTGKIITTVASGTLASASTNLVIYRTFLPYTVTTTVATLNNGSDGSPVCSICGPTGGLNTRVSGPFAEVSGGSWGQPIFQGPVARFGGRFVPVYTAGLSANFTPANQWNFPFIYENSEDADDMTKWTPTLANDAECWGQAPGYIGPEGGGYSVHLAVGCMMHLVGDVLAANSMPAWDIPSGGATVIATTSGTATVPAGASWLNLKPSGTIASFTVVMPAAPMNNQPVTISSTQAITALTISGNTGQTINGAATTLAANAGITYRWDVSSLSWNRVQ